MSKFDKTNRNTVNRIAKRGSYNKKKIYSILDEGLICHVGFEVEGQPFVIPTIYGREKNKIYIHGSSQSRLANHAGASFPLCITVTIVDGLVMARSLFHHSMNYRSAVVFGKGRFVTENKKNHALKIISNHILENRWDEARHPNEKELKSTHVIEMEIETGSAKIRTGPPGDDKADMKLDVWAGVVPIETKFGEVITETTGKKMDIPESVKQLMKNKISEQ